MLRRHLYKLALSAAVSFLALGCVFGVLARSHPGVTPAALVHALRNAVPLLVAVYVLAQLGQGGFRAWRSRLLLRAGAPDGRVPGPWHMFWVTLVRGMFVDMLPARLGELSYVALLNRGYQVGADVCLSSLSVGLVFDFLALLVVLAVAIPGAAQGVGLIGSALVLAMVCAVGYVGLFHLLPWGVGWVRLSWPRALVAWKPFAAVLQLASDTSDSVVLVRRARILPSVLALSAAVRVCKYAGLYALFVAVTRPLWPELSAASPWAVLVALIAAEGAASLPVPTFMSFGTYEAGGLAALTALGFAAADSVMAMFALHVLSQAVDYSLGTVAYGIFSARLPATVSRSPAPRARRLRAVAVIVVLAGALAFALAKVRAIRRLGSLTPPQTGAAVQYSTEEQSVRASVLSGFRGRIVWSSNRFGQHDLLMMEFPGERLTRLTSHPHTETYPRISPDGRRVAFCRSQIPWVSQRNPVPWDTLVMDIGTRAETVVATNAFTPVWTSDGSAVVAVREGRRVVRQSLDTATPLQTLLTAGEAGVPDVFFQTPDLRADGALTVTFRGPPSGTMVCAPDGSLRKIAGGCQIGWFPGGESVLYVDHGGRGKNAFYQYALAAGSPALLFDAPGLYSHEYFPRVSHDGKWLVFAASAEGHEHDTADYEIFLWRIGSPMASAARLTAHSGNDCWPDVFLDE